jgi:hypothetical protein
VQVTGTDIVLTIIATEIGRILVENAGSTVVNGYYYPFADSFGYLQWSKDGLDSYPKFTGVPGSWNLELSADSVGYINSDSVDYPSQTFSEWTRIDGLNPSPDVSHEQITASVLQEIVNDFDSSTLVTASSTGTGTVAAVAATPLTGGSDTPRWRLTAAGSVLLAASTETYPWNILPAAWNGGPPTITPAESSISGLDHLEGEEVVILADGSVHRPVTVSGGAITLDYSVTKAVIGLPYAAVIEPTWLESPDVAGFSKAGKKRIHRIITELWRTAGVELSVDNGATWKPMETRSVSDLMDSNRVLITGLREEFVGGSTARQISCILRSKDPLPMLLQSLHIRYQIDAK